MVQYGQCCTALITFCCVAEESDSIQPVWLPNWVAVQVRPSPPLTTLSSLHSRFSPMSGCKCCVWKMAVVSRVPSLSLFPQPQPPQTRTAPSEPVGHPLCQELAQHAVSDSSAGRLSDTQTLSVTCKLTFYQEINLFFFFLISLFLFSHRVV